MTDDERLSVEISTLEWVVNALKLGATMEQTLFGNEAGAESLLRAADATEHTMENRKALLGKGGPSEPL